MGVMTKFMLVCMALLLPTLLTAQVPDPQLRFEVAAINPVADVAAGARIGIEDNSAVVRIENLTLRALIRIAYGVMDEQLSGPGWLNDTRFTITARPPSGYQSAHLPVLMRNLLADRFGLVVHHEKKEVAGFALRVAPGGHRLITGSERTFLTGRRGLISGRGRKISEIVPILAENVASPVIDETGLSGVYDVKLEWNPQLTAGANAGDAGVSLFTALREQLGLRLEPIRVGVDVVVVDRIARAPTDN